MIDRPMSPSMRTLQIADQVLGILGCLILQPLRLGSRRRVAQAPVRRVLFVKFWGVGSLQHLTAAAQHLKRRHPEAELVLLTLARNEAFARGFGTFDRLFTLEVRGAGVLRLGARILRCLRQLRSARFDRVYDFEFFTRFSALVSALSRAPSTYGFTSPSVWRGGFHAHRIAFRRDQHVARNFLNLAQTGERAASSTASALHTTNSLAPVPYQVRPQDEEALETALRGAGGWPRGYIVLNPNAGCLCLERRWPAEHFANLAARLLQESELGLLFIGSRDERQRTAAIVADARARAGRAGQRIFDLSGSLEAGPLCALLAGARLVISNDSGPMHLAAALGAPTLGLFGPETPLLYSPLGPRARALWDPPPCSPCINVHDGKRATCIHGRPECLMNLTVDGVLRAALEWLEEPAESLPAHPDRCSPPRAPASPAASKPSSLPRIRSAG